MYDLKEKEKQIKSKFSAIQKANETKTGVNDTLSQFDDTIENLQGQIGSTIDGFTSKAKKKLPNTDNIFERISGDLNQILPKKNGESLLRTATRQSIKQTADLIKPIFLANIRKLFFANDSDLGCGMSTVVPLSGMTISPKEFDVLDILQTDPFSKLGKIVYEDTLSSGKVKMNRVFYESFSSPYNFIAQDESQIFQMEWDGTIQKFKLSGLNNGNITVDQFITKYYESIEFPKMKDVVKAAFSMLVPTKDGPNQYDVKLSKLVKALNACMGYCDDRKDPLKRTPTDIPENNIDILDFFNFDAVEGIDLDDENRRLNKVLRFVDCNNYDLPVNENIVEDFGFYASTKNEIAVLAAYDQALAKLAKEAASGETDLSFLDFSIGLNFQSLKQLPKALLSTVMSPKFLFPIAVFWKMLKEQTANAIVDVQTLMKNVTKFLYNTLKDIYNKFLEIFWKIVKPQIAVILKDLIKRIMKNSKSKLKRIILALIDILSMVIPFLGVKNCEDFYNAILQVLSLIRTGVNQQINGFLLQLSKRLPGYSEDRAIMNIGEFLEANGIPTGDLYGQENNVMSFVSSIVKGHQKEMDENSFVQVSLDYGQIPVAPLGGAAVIPPGVLKAHGKLT
jgi:hypothetical protein